MNKSLMNMVFIKRISPYQTSCAQGGRERRERREGVFSRERGRERETERGEEIEVKERKHKSTSVGHVSCFGVQLSRQETPAKALLVEPSKWRPVCFCIGKCTQTRTRTDTHRHTQTHTDTEKNIIIFITVNIIIIRIIIIIITNIIIIITVDIIIVIIIIIITDMGTCTVAQSRSLTSLLDTDAQLFVDALLCC